MAALSFSIGAADLMAGEGIDALPSLLPVGGWILRYDIAPMTSDSNVVLSSGEVWANFSGTARLQLRGRQSDPKQFGWISLDGDHLTVGLYVTEGMLDRLIDLYAKGIRPEFLTVRTNTIEYGATPAHTYWDNENHHVAIIQSYNLTFEGEISR